MSAWITHSIGSSTAPRELAFAHRVIGELENSGVRLSAGNRLELARRLLADLTDGSVRLEPHDVPLQHRVAAAQRLITDLYTILRAGPLLPKDHWLSKLALVLQGPELRASEGRRSLARDTQFELVLGALLKLGGAADLRLDEPDLRLTAAGREIGVAAKRIRSFKQFRKRLANAVDQLRLQNLRGLIALNIEQYLEGLSLFRDPSTVGLDFRQRTDPPLTQEIHRIVDPSVLGIIRYATVLEWSFSNALPYCEHSFFFSAHLITDDVTPSQEELDLQTILAAIRPHLQAILTDHA